MLTRRLLLSALPIAAATNAQAASDTFAGFLAALGAEARRAGISAATLDQALAGLAPNAKVLERDRHQPEFTMTWAQYRAMLITDKRIDAGRAAVQRQPALLSAVQARFGVGPAVITGIWGLESSFGTQTGDFHVVDALATLAWDGRRASFFRPELIAALKILDHGDVTPPRMIGSYAGAMGQPQFMPTSFLRYAVDFDGNGRRDIWTNRADVLASIANYLAQSGWRPGETWGQAVTLPAGSTPVRPGRDVRRPLAEWARQGVRPVAGRWWAAAEPTPRCCCRMGRAARRSWSIPISLRSGAIIPRLLCLGGRAARGRSRGLNASNASCPIPACHCERREAIPRARGCDLSGEIASLRSQ